VATLLLACGCNSKNAHPDNGTFVKALEALDAKVPSGAKLIMLIPLEGCRKCAETCIAFSKEYLNNPNVVFVLISGMGMREARRRYSTEELEASNLLLDGKGFFLKGGMVRGEVTLLHLENGTVVDKETFPSDMMEEKIALRAEGLK
jgi:hypothetical protein